MKSARELRMLRRGKGYDSQRSMSEVLAEHGIKMTPQAYCMKENGKSKFKPKEIKALSEIFEMTLEDAFDAFS